MAIEEAVTTPGMKHRERGRISSSRRSRESHPGARLEFKGERASLALLVDKYGVVDYYTARARRHRGWPLEKVLLEPKRVSA